MFIIYGKDNCIWCDRAKELIGDINYVYYDVMSNVKARQEMLGHFPGAKTVPQIMKYHGYSGEYDLVGTYEDLIKYLK